MSVFAEKFNVSYISDVIKLHVDSTFLKLLKHTAWLVKILVIYCKIQETYKLTKSITSRRIMTVLVQFQ